MKKIRDSYNRIAGVLMIPLLLIAGYAFYLHTSTGAVVADYTSIKKAFDSSSVEVNHWKNRDSLDVAEKIALKAQNEGSIKELSEANFKLTDQVQNNNRAIAFFAKVQQEMKLAMTTIKYDSNAVPLIAKNRSDSVAVPRKFSMKDSLMSISGYITKTGITLDSPKFYNTVYLQNVTRKYGFLKLKEAQSVQVMNTNKYVTNTGLAAVYIDKRPNWWNRWGKPATAAFLGGALVYLIRK